MSDTPLITIITTCLNAAETIKDTIASIRMQDYPNIEHIITDGASSDGTVGLVRKLCRNTNTTIISEPDRGIYDGMNKGIAMAHGDVVGFLNADDMYYDAGVVSSIAESFTPDVDCVYGNLIYVARKNLDMITRRWLSSDYHSGLFQKSWTPAHPTFYCRRDAYLKYGVYRIDFKIAADAELMYRFLEKHKLRSRYIDRYMVKMRTGGVSTRNLRSTWVITKEARQGFIENGGEFNLITYLYYKVLKAKRQLSSKAA